MIASERVSETWQLAMFFGALAVKQYVRPDLHVRPLVAELFLTENCNLRCRSCACWRETTRDELSTDEWKDVIEQLALARILKVNFTGGEPLIRRDAISLMRHATSVGIRHLHLNTNALLLTETTLREVLSAGVRSFNVSVDGPESIHDHIRGRKGAFGITVAHLRDLIGKRSEYDLKLRLNFTVMRDNVAVLPQVAELAQELGIRLYLNLATDRTFLFRDAEVSGEAQVEADQLRASLAALERMARSDRRWLPRYSDLRYVPKHFSNVLQRELPCAESQLKLMIHSQGQIGGCWAHDPSFNVRERSIEFVLNSAEYRREHARFFRKDCAGCGSNYSLNLRWRPLTYVNDVLWQLRLRSLAQPD
jgi:MoaA/NifB/PqqE/SkfB family radical SAM enzyme